VTRTPGTQFRNRSRGHRNRERARERLGAALDTFQRIGAVREIETIRTALERLRALTAAAGSARAR
jgi:hypothetical protein